LSIEHPREVARSFDERVVELLAYTEFPGDTDIGDPLRRAHASIGRANNYRRCCRFWSGIRCLYGSRKRVSEKPKRGVGSSGRGAKRPGPVLSLRDSNKSRYLGCPVYGGSEWEGVDGAIVSGQLVVLRSGDG